MKNLQTFDEFLNESVLQQIQFTDNTIQHIWDSIITTAENAPNQEFNFNSTEYVNFSPNNSGWKDIIDNKNNWRIGVIDATSGELLISIINDKNFVKYYLFISGFDVKKQSPKNKVYIEIIDISKFRGVNRFKSTVYQNLY